ncbi:MAG: acyl-CoA dehydrogenase family protein [Acidimicrobiales bacterium]|nr:acyl-CoA dehydrogenase family protein [Acidimicrobiales bacterium]
MTAKLEDPESFRERAREFVIANLRPSSGSKLVGILRDERTDEEELAEVAREREIQRGLFEAQLAGVCVPKAYGGQGLTPAHQAVLNDELIGREYPMRLQSPTFAPCLSVLLEFGSEEQKLRHIPAILKGEEIWMQFLSEPSGGSDVAGALTTAIRDGDEWILNGSKVWTTGAWWSDWGLCLARTNWDVPKHRGLTVFMLPIDREGVEVHRIEMLNGSKEFCQEFLTDVRVPDSDRIGGVDDGWTVGTRWMFHERMGTNSPLTTQPKGGALSGPDALPMVSIAGDADVLDDRRALDLIGEAESLAAADRALRGRLGDGIAAGTISDQASAIGRLFAGRVAIRTTTIGMDLAGAAAAAWAEDDESLVEIGHDYLMRQVSCIGGGTTEMAANVVSERVLGMPRERTLDRDVAFRDVPRSPSH